MPIRIICRKCGKKYEVSEHRQGQDLPCKICGAVFHVPRQRSDVTPRSQSPLPGGSSAPAATRDAPNDWLAKARGGFVAMMVFGVVSFLLPMFDLQLRMFARLGAAAPIAGAICAVAGAALFLISMRHRILIGASADDNTLLAKEGYGLAEINLNQPKDFVQGMQLIFSKIDGNRLNTSDTYTSEWVGVPRSTPTTTISGDGRVVFGFCGRRGLVTNAVGLMYASQSCCETIGIS